MALMTGFAGVLFGAVLVSSVGALRSRFKAAWLRRRLDSAAVRERTALRCSLAESGTSLRLVPGLLRHRSSFMSECAGCEVR